jgi:hypothetical protein
MGGGFRVRDFGRFAHYWAKKFIHVLLLEVKIMSSDGKEEGKRIKNAEFVLGIGIGIVTSILVDALLRILTNLLKDSYTRISVQSLIVFVCLVLLYYFYKQFRYLNSINDYSFYSIEIIKRDDVSWDVIYASFKSTFQICIMEKNTKLQISWIKGVVPVLQQYDYRLTLQTRVISTLSFVDFTKKSSKNKTNIDLIIENAETMKDIDKRVIESLNREKKIGHIEKTSTMTKTGIGYYTFFNPIRIKVIPIEKKK